MPLEQEQFDTINKKLDVIDAKVTEEEPSFWEKYGSYVKWILIGGAWILGEIFHEWGPMHLVSKLIN